jgi:Na+/H+-translocating membrane pyrophosphatase
MITGLKLYSFIFIALSILIAVSPFLKNKKVKTTDDTSLLINFIIQGTKLVLKRFYKYLCIICIAFVIMAFSLKVVMNEPALRVFLCIPALITSMGVGWICLKISLSSIKSILGNAHLSINSVMTSANHKSRLILTILMAIMLCDLLFWMIGLEYLITHKIFNVSATFAAEKHMFLATSIAGYVIGTTLHSVFARFNFSIFATSFDSAADLIGFSKYDFPEDDLRNPASVPDLIGDQLKHNYLTFSSFHSMSIGLIVGLSILGSFITLFRETSGALDLIIFPLFYTTLGLFITLAINLIVQCIPIIKDSFFWKKVWQQTLSAVIIILITFIFCKNSNWPMELFYSSLLGLLFSCLLYPIVYHFISIRSKAIQFVAKHSKDSVLSTISSGLFLGFFAAFLITLLLCFFIEIGFSISGDTVHVFDDFYNIGFMALAFLIGSFSIFTDSFCKPIIDNAVGISEMLGFKDKEKKQLHMIHANCNVGMCYFYIASIITVSLSTFVYLILFTIKSLKSAPAQSVLPHINVAINQTVTHFQYLDLTELIIPYEIHFLNTKFTLGILLGLSLLVGSIALVMWSVSSAYKKINTVMQEELDANPAIWTGEECPHYLKGVETIARFSNRFMIVSVFSILLFSVSTWLLLGVGGTIGFLIGQLTGGVILSLFFIISGYTWANTKQLIESDASLIGHPEHVSVIFADKLGDLFKDAIAPIIIEAMKLLILLAIVLLSAIISMDKIISIWSS